MRTFVRGIRGCSRRREAELQQLRFVFIQWRWQRTIYQLRTSRRHIAHRAQVSRTQGNALCQTIWSQQWRATIGRGIQRIPTESWRHVSTTMLFESSTSLMHVLIPLSACVTLARVCARAILIVFHYVTYKMPCIRLIALEKIRPI